VADIDVRINELGLQGRCCTQILVRLALDDRGDENEQLAEATGALCLGLFSGIGCGALSGGALAMWVLAGRPVDGGVVAELVDWFRERYGSTDCEAILGGDPGARLSVCPAIVGETYAEVRDLLDAYQLLPS
jgi:hypothetical protein